MTRAERQYVRIYHDDLARDYPHVWTDDLALVAFTRLLVVADKMWPAPPELPRSVRPKALVTLTRTSAVTGHSLVELLPGHCYRIRGHDAERIKRQDSARNAAAVRWDSGRNATGNAETMPSPRPSRAEPNTPPPAELGRRKEGTNPRALGTNPRANGTSPRQVRQAEKRAGLPVSVHEILRRAAATSDQ